MPPLISSQNYMPSAKSKAVLHLVIEDGQKEKDQTKSPLENKYLFLSCKVTEDNTSSLTIPQVHPRTLWKDVLGRGRVVMGNRWDRHMGYMFDFSQSRQQVTVMATFLAKWKLAKKIKHRHSFHPEAGKVGGGHASLAKSSCLNAFFFSKDFSYPIHFHATCPELTLLLGLSRLTPTQPYALKVWVVSNYCCRARTSHS